MVEDLDSDHKSGTWNDVACWWERNKGMLVQSWAFVFITGAWFHAQRRNVLIV